MPNYPSAEALVTDALLRLDHFGPEGAMLVVEGPHDKRVFVDRTNRRQQILVSGGRRLLLAAHAMVLEKGVNRLLFLADCDYDIPMKILTPAPALVITEFADLESDLMAYGGWDRLVSHLIPETLDNDDRFYEVASIVKMRTIGLAEVIGRYRRIARLHAFKAETDVRHIKYRPSPDVVDEGKLVRALWQNSEGCPLTFAELASKVNDIEQRYENCNGHDLMAAFSHVIREDFNVRGQTADSLEILLRLGMTDRSFADWSVIKRIRRWELETGYSLLRHS